ncbi:hypothetical protein DV736_g5737, partial [Chaetothyriales sp. CBS 134916]
MSADSFSLAGRGLKLDSKEDVEKHVQSLKESSTVKHIDLSGNTFGVEASVALASILSTKPSLQSADLHDIFTSRLLGEIPRALSSLLTALLQCPNLHTVDLSDNAFGLNTKDPLVDFLSKHIPLKHLVLNNNGMGPIAGTAIAEALTTLAEKKAAARKDGKEGPLLESIVCGRNRLENGSMAAWAKAYDAHKSGIKSVKMTQNGIRPEGISLLISAGLSKCTNIEVCDLQDNTFTFAGSVVLSKALLGWPNLKELGLSDDYLGGRGSVKVFQALESGKNKNIEILKLEYNDITPAGLQTLLKAAKDGLPRLRRIELNGNKFDEDDPAIEKLSELLSERKEELGKNSDPVDYWEHARDAVLRDADENEDESVSQQQSEDVDKLADALVSRGDFIYLSGSAMRTLNVLTLALTTPSVIAVLVSPFVAEGPSSQPSPEGQPRHQLYSPQAAMNPDPVQPPSAQPQDQGMHDDSGLAIADILPKTRNINIFASLTRDISSISDRLESNHSRDNTTLLAPLNSVMQSLPRKPWEDKLDDTDSVRASNNEEKAAHNIQSFVEEHIVPVSPWKEGKEGKTKTIGGQELWWEQRGDKRYVMPSDLLVDAVVGRVGNGEIWAIKGVVNY